MLCQRQRHDLLRSTSPGTEILESKGGGTVGGQGERKGAELGGGAGFIHTWKLAIRLDTGPRLDKFFSGVTWELFSKREATSRYR